MNDAPSICDLRNTFADMRGTITNSIKSEPLPKTAVQLCERCFRIEQKRAAVRQARNRQYKANLEFKDVLIEWK